MSKNTKNSPGTIPYTDTKTQRNHDAISCIQKKKNIVISSYILSSEGLFEWIIFFGNCSSVLGNKEYLKQGIWQEDDSNILEWAVSREHYSLKYFWPPLSILFQPQFYHVPPFSGTCWLGAHWSDHWLINVCWNGCLSKNKFNWINYCIVLHCIVLYCNWEVGGNVKDMND